MKTMRSNRRFLQLLRPIAVTGIFLILSGCAIFNGTKFEGVLGTSENLVDLAYTIAEDLERQAYPPLTPRNQDLPLLTTTFVNNSNLEQTSHFSRILQEHLTSRFVQMGYAVREIKLQKNLLIQPGIGEKMLSRRLEDIKPTQSAQAITAGTFSLTSNIIYISARMINPENGNIISSADYSVPMNKEMMVMFGLHNETNVPATPVEKPQKSFITWLFY